jgi:hypothetical protein
VSFFRPRFPDRPLVADDFEATFRMRGLKGFQPHHVLGLQDALFADEPGFWSCTADLAAGAAGTFNHLGVLLPDTRDLIVIVDRVWATSTTAGDLYIVEVNTGEGATIPAVSTDTQVFLGNRRDQGPVTGIAQRAGLSRVADTSVIIGQSIIAQWRALANVSFLIPVSYRLYKNESCWVRNGNAVQGLTATMQGRVMKRT